MLVDNEPVVAVVAGQSGDVPVAKAPGPGPGHRPVAGRLEFFPVTFFSVVLGLAGTAVAWRRAHEVLGLPDIGVALAWVALAGYAAIATTYLAKMIRHPARVRAEYRSPMLAAFLPTVTIGPLLLAVAFLGVADMLSALLWWAGASGQLVLTLAILSRWIHDPATRVEHVHPAWFIPVVGNLVVPLAGMAHAPAEVSWFFFSIGLLYWLVLLTLLLNRLFFHAPLPARLTPTLAILLAPPAVAFLAHLRLGGHATDPVARILLSIAVFQTVLLLTQLPALRRVSFFLSWWAVSFPVAAVTIALLVAARDTGSDAAAWGGGSLLALLTVLLVGLLGRTTLAMARRQLCRPE